jgi:tetratricopeptide (TPR) repeat protein
LRRRQYFNDIDRVRRGGFVGRSSVTHKGYFRNIPVTIVPQVVGMKTNSKLSILVNGIKALALPCSFAVALAANTAIGAAAPSELLEQGIYSEETKGDLDAALQLYQKVIAEGKAGEAVAAQAQYRLGVCYYKKKDYTAANTAFEKLLKDYPDQKEYVKLANQYLIGAVALLPAPWADGEELKMDIKFPTGYKIGAAHYTVDAGETNGQKIWRLGMALSVGIFQGSRSEVEADSFKPLHCRWKHSLIGEADTTYFPGYAEVKLKGKDEVKKVELEGVIYDNEEAAELIRRLPLATNYSTTLRILTGLGGGNIIPIKIEVTGIDTVKVPAGTFESYRVELQTVHQTFWYSTDAHHYIVKFEAGGVAAELSEVNVRKPGDTVKYNGPGFSLAAPSDWFFCPIEDREDKAKTLVMLVDPDGATTSRLTLRSLDALVPEAKKSVRAWAEYQVAQAAKLMKDLKVRPESWQDRTLSGNPAVGLTADYVGTEHNDIAYGVFTFNGTNAMELYFSIAADQFDSFRPVFDAIINSYATK